MKIDWLEQTVGDVPDNNLWLSAREENTLNAMRFPKRRSEWRLGRWTAKQGVAASLNTPSDWEALAQIEVRAALSGAPEVFIADSPAPIAISLSHRTGTAMCAVGPLDCHFGCDLEIVEPRGDAFVADYFTDTEKQRIEIAPGDHRPELVTLMWSAKESALKALRAGLRLDTRSVVANPCLESESSTKAWRPVVVTYADTQQFSGWWRLENSLVRTIVANLPLDIPHRMRLGCPSPERYAVCS